MFKWEENKPKEELIDSIINLISEHKIENMYVPEILADVLYKYDTDMDYLYYLWTSDYYFNRYVPKMIEDMMFIQRHLIRNKHTFKNKGGHGAGDSYVFYIPVKNKIVQCYEDQHLNFICIYEKIKYLESLHIRRFWDKPSKKRYEKNPTLKEFRDIINHNGIGTKSPMRYLDSRDPGYILTYDRFKRRIDGSNYSEKFIRHAIFNIGSQATHFREMDRNNET